MTKLKVIEGTRDELDRKLLREIWLGSLEEADRLIAKLRSLPQHDLRLVMNDNPELPAKRSQE